jgi:hypothetical protein
MIMKYLLSLILVCSALSAQSFTIHLGETDVIGDVTEELVADGYAINTSGETINFRIDRTVNTLPGDWMSSICIDLCYAPWVNSADADILPGDTLDFSLHFFTDDTPAAGSVELVFSDNAGTSPITQMFTGTTSTTGIGDAIINANSLQLFGNYPNPFNGSTQIAFFVPIGVTEAEIVVYNSAGQKVAGSAMEFTTSGRYLWRFNPESMSRSLSSGTYFYRVLAGNGQSLSGKLIYAK